MIAIIILPIVTIAIGVLISAPEIQSFLKLYCKFNFLKDFLSTTTKKYS